MMSVQNAPAPLAYVSIDSVVKDEPLDINDAEHNPFASDTGNAEVPPPPTAVPDPPSAANESRRQIDMDILVTVVAKLELMTEKLAAAAFIDQYDQFGKYLVSLLRKIPHRKQHWIKLKLLGEINMALDSNEHQPSNPYPFMLDYQNLTSPIVVEGHTPMQPPPQMNVPVSQGYTVNKANPPPRVRSNERRKRLISNNKASKSVNVTTVSDEDNSVSATELNEPPSKSPSNLSRGKEKPRPSTEPDPTLFKTTANLTLFEDLDRTDSTEEPGPAQGPLYRTDPSLHAMRKTYKSKATKSPRLDSKRIKVSSIHSASRILSGENRNLAKPIPRQTDPSSSNTKPDSSLHGVQKTYQAKASFHSDSKGSNQQAAAELRVKDNLQLGELEQKIDVDDLLLTPSNAKLLCTVVSPLSCIQDTECSEDQTSLTETIDANSTLANEINQHGHVLHENLLKAFRKRDEPNKATNSGKSLHRDQRGSSKKQTDSKVLVSKQEGQPTGHFPPAEDVVKLEDDVVEVFVTDEAPNSKNPSLGLLNITPPLSTDTPSPTSYKKCNQPKVPKIVKSNSEQTFKISFLKKLDGSVLGGWCRCPMKCLMKINVSDWKRLLNTFKNMNHDDKTAYIARCVKKLPAASGKIRNKYVYKVKVNGNTVEVCKQRFMTLHGIDNPKGKNRLTYVIKSIINNNKVNIG